MSETPGTDEVPSEESRIKRLREWARRALLREPGASIIERTVAEDVQHLEAKYQRDLAAEREKIACIEMDRDHARLDAKTERERADRNQEDAERLDWMDSHGFTAYREIDPGDGQLSDHATCVSEHHSTCGIGRFGHVATTIRAAIDAARRK